MNEYQAKVDALTAELAALDQMLDSIMSVQVDPAGKPRAVLLAEVIARAQSLFADRQVAQQKVDQLREFEAACREHAVTAGAAYQAEFIAEKARVIGRLASDLAARGQVGFSAAEAMYNRLRDQGFSESTLNSIRAAYPRPNKKATIAEAEAEYQSRVSPAEEQTAVK